MLIMKYGESDSVLRNLFTFSGAVLDLKGYESELSFVESYPFIPYQFRLMQNILEEIRKHGHAGKNSSGGARPMLAEFQETAQAIEERDENALVPLYLFYNPVHASLQKYNVVVTNPPYLGNGRFSNKLDSYVKENYQDEKSDLSMVMLNKALSGFAIENGFVAFITTTSWMFLSGFETVRMKLYENSCISSLVDYGTELFEGKVGHNSIVSWVTRACSIPSAFTAVRLVDYCYAQRDRKEPEFFNNKNRYVAKQKNFVVIPTAPVAYWVSDNLLDDYKKAERLDNIAQPKQGIKTADKDRFLRFWQEIDYTKTSIIATDSGKWFPCNKGGVFRKWYGNNEYVVNWENNGYEICNFRDENGKLKSRPQNLQYMLREGITYTNISLSSFGARYSPPGYIYDAAGSGIFCEDNSKIYYVLGFLTSSVAAAITKITSPTMSFEVGQISTLPFIYSPNQEVDELVHNSINTSKSDWDSYETSWEFKSHPLI